MYFRSILINSFLVDFGAIRILEHIELQTSERLRADQPGMPMAGTAIAQPLSSLQ